MKSIYSIYEQLFNYYGTQGWWPLIGHDGSNPTKTGSHRGYHPNDYSFPKNREQQFEIVVGAILTQNTAWSNVEMALNNLNSRGVLHSPLKLLESANDSLKEAIRPAGYFNQKCEYLKSVAAFFLECDSTPDRNQLLAIHGIGEETADAILLYAFSVPSFVIDAYTKRFLIYHGIIQGNESYRSIQQIFHGSLPMEYQLFQEFHALFVEHGKRFFSRKPYKDTCFIFEE